MYVCIAYIHTHTCTYTYVCMYCTYACMHVCMYACMYDQIHKHTLFALAATIKKKKTTPQDSVNGHTYIHTYIH